MFKSLSLTSAHAATLVILTGAGTAFADPKGHALRFEDLRTQADLQGYKQAGDTPLPGILIAPETRFVAEGLLATGYDSNIDYLISDDDKAAFGLADIGLGLITGPADAQTTVVARGGYGRYGLDNRPDRWDAGILIDHYRALGGGSAVDLGGFFLHDDIDVDAAERAAGYYELTNKSETRDLFWRGRIMNTHYLEDFGTVQPDRLFSRDETFDFIRIEQSAGLLLLKDQRLSPYFEAGYAHLDYTHERNPAIFSRDGDEIWTTGGIRVTFDETLHVDIGARYNNRWIDDPVIHSHDSIFFDGKLVWTPSEHLYVEANIDRVFLEPIDTGSLLTESTTYSILTITDIDDRTRLKLEAGHITENQLGTPDVYQHIYGQARLTYRVHDGMELFGTVNGYHTRNEDTALEADRIETLAGVRFSN